MNQNTTIDCTKNTKFKKYIYKFIRIIKDERCKNKTNITEYFIMPMQIYKIIRVAVKLKNYYFN